MIDLSTLFLFISVSLVFLVTPGPSVLYIMAASIDQGKKAGIASALGIEIGTLVHILFAAFGLSAIIVASALAFNAVKYLGAFYLIYLGVKKIASGNKKVTDVNAPPKSLRMLFYQGVIVNVLNPKTALFFLAFLPQFVKVENGNVTSQILSLGFVFFVLALVSDITYALLASKVGNFLKNSTVYMRVQHYIIGGFYIMLGAAALMWSSSAKGSK